MRTTPHKASFVAYDLSRRYATDDRRRLLTPLSEAKIDLNPHQIEAALFAIESPFAKGVLLADEVGLGKTIEAGLLLAQRWSEDRRRLIVIAPASLTRQWADELRDKFHLPAVVLTSQNTPSSSDAAIAGILELRRLHVELDTAVRDAYGWQDLPLEHDFYEVETLPENDRVRYTISPAARKELLKRLLAENHRRAAAESAAVAQTPASKSRPTKRGRRPKTKPASGDLFADEE